ILAKSTVLNGAISSPYKTSPAKITNWHVKEIRNNETGIFKSTAQQVTYIYEKNNTDKKKDNNQGMDKKDPLQEKLPNTGDSSTDGLFGILLGLMIITTAVLYLFKYNPK
ncbi:cell wall anchor protein, partial [Listeria booriae]|uniref:MucBP domain-containing protein n=1 Tax=Listeria booriae TaxID=1552123 RepID=UPI0016233305